MPYVIWCTTFSLKFPVHYVCTKQAELVHVVNANLVFCWWQTVLVCSLNSSQWICWVRPSYLTLSIMFEPKAIFCCFWFEMRPVFCLSGYNLWSSNYIIIGKRQEIFGPVQKSESIFRNYQWFEYPGTYFLFLHPFILTLRNSIVWDQFLQPPSWLL